MKIILAAFLFFLIAFVGLAAGLLLKRRGLSGGCQSAADTGGECRCKPETTAELPSEVREVGREFEQPEDGGSPQETCPTCGEENENIRR